MGVTAALASLGKRIGCLAGGDTIERGILDARVTHIRHAERRYVLSHRLSYLHVGLDDLGRLPRPWFGYNRSAVAVIRDRDYGQGNMPLGEWIAEALRAGNAVHPGGRIVLLTLPRVAGLAFNPVTFWFCHDPEGDLRAVLAEVNSTFGERHCYVPAASPKAALSDLATNWRLARPCMSRHSFLSKANTSSVSMKPAIAWAFSFLSCAAVARSCLLPSPDGSRHSPRAQRWRNWLDSRYPPCAS